MIDHSKNVVHKIDKIFWFGKTNWTKIKVVIVPCGINVNVTEEEKNNLMEACQNYEKLLSSAGIRVKGKLFLNELIFSFKILYS